MSGDNLVRYWIDQLKALQEPASAYERGQAIAVLIYNATTPKQYQSQIEELAELFELIAWHTPLPMPGALGFTRNKPKRERVCTCERDEHGNTKALQPVGLICDLHGGIVQP